MGNFLNFLLNESGYKKAMKSGSRADKNKEASKQSLRAEKKRKEAQAREMFADKLGNTNSELRASVDMSRNALKDSANKNTLNVRELNKILPGEAQSISDENLTDLMTLIRKSIKLR